MVFDQVGDGGMAGGADAQVVDAFMAVAIGRRSRNVDTEIDVIVPNSLAFFAGGITRATIGSLVSANSLVTEDDLALIAGSRGNGGESGAGKTQQNQSHE